MVSHATNDAQKLYYLGEALELMRATFFRQTMFASSQLAIHEEVEGRQGAIGHADVGNLLRPAQEISRRCTRRDDDRSQLLRRVGGSSRTSITASMSGNIATSMAGARRIRGRHRGNERKAGAGAFHRAAQGGGSAYPYDIYKKAGLDMASPDPYQALARAHNRTMDQIDTLEAKAH